MKRTEIRRGQRERPPTVQQVLDARAAAAHHASLSLRRRNAEAMHAVAARLPLPARVDREGARNNSETAARGWATAS